MNRAVYFVGRGRTICLTTRFGVIEDMVSELVEFRIKTMLDKVIAVLEDVRG